MEKCVNLLSKLLTNKKIQIFFSKIGKFISINIQCLIGVREIGTFTLLVKAM